MKLEGYVTNIVVYLAKEGWVAELDWATGKFLDEPDKQNFATEGTISTMYQVPSLSQAIDAVVDKIQEFGLQKNPMGVALLYKGDAENSKYPAPENYLELLKAESEKRGWVTYDQLTVKKKQI
ncbi:hypothetical protein [Priestia megaterium]|uniref:Uncharacterized protein n=1 Tax=Priestia megaterium TaxID=1404 RepID=A0A6M6E3F9_PRIMG|nr:hypothetical protein [Priestia megaterium]QJX80246.1 hypothetical protein FDZ14_29560 [Priestia megaterium]